MIITYWSTIKILHFFVINLHLTDIQLSDMKNMLLTLLFISISLIGYTQGLGERNNSIGISIPIIFNNSNGVYYSLGNRKEPKGKANSYGLNINYSKKYLNSMFVNVGVGYFKQSFNINRPFDFSGDTVTNLLYSTEKYNYDCITLGAGIGYNYKFKDRLRFNGLASLNFFNSFKQEYTPNGYSGFQHQTVETTSKNMNIGYSINVSGGVEYYFSNYFSLSVDVVLPVLTKWGEDEIFISSDFGNDAHKIAENRFAFGNIISLKYHF